MNNLIQIDLFNNDDDVPLPSRTITNTLLMCSCIFSDESPKVIFFIEKIDYKTAMIIVVEKHYLHRKSPCSFSFLLSCKYCKMPVGVIVYGTPSSPTLRTGICGIDEQNNVIELTRLWIKDGTPKNTESYLIGNTLKLVDKEIIVSFAEIEAGHLGVVYQATNWIYTGLSAKRPNYKIDGIDLHTTTITDEGRGQKNPVAFLREKYGDKLKTFDRPRKHRYIFFNANKWRKKELTRKLKYTITPYPKLSKDA